MMTLEEARANILRRVIYRYGDGQPGERGEITSVSRTMVFVRYDGDRQSKATRPEDLTWLDPDAPPPQLPPADTEEVPSESVIVWLPPSLLRDSQRYAGAEGFTFSGLVRLALRAYLDSP